MVLYTKKVPKMYKEGRKNQKSIKKNLKMLHKKYIGKMGGAEVQKIPKITYPS